MLMIKSENWIVNSKPILVMKYRIILWIVVL